jgi:pyruvate dehydrogenase E1 component alpha subunit
MDQPTRAQVKKAARPRDDAGGTPVATFSIPYSRVLDSAGKPVGPVPAFARDKDVVIAIYRTMVLTRQFDARAISLQRTGQLGTYPSSLGQEAVSTATAKAMKAEDVLLATYRDTGAYLTRGVTLTELLQFWGGDERGLDWAGPRRDFPPSIPIASHVPHAAGVAYAMKLRKEPRVAVCMLGDGATSKGDFYEAINLAGVWQLPAVFVVINNGWAISVPVGRQTACATLAQKAIAAGMPGEQVDGNDALAVHDAALRAVERARAGKGPALIEALTYRLADHTTADDARRYRSEEEVSKHWAFDPVARLRAYIGAAGWWTKEDEEALIAACRAQIEEAQKAYLALPKPAATEMFDNLYATLPPALAAQRAALKDHG